MNRLFTLLIVLAMAGGIAAGWACHTWLGPADIRTAVDSFGLITDLFLRAIRMVIAPLVFATLVAGIAHMEDTASVGRIGVRALVWFVFSSLVSLAIGLVVVRLLEPGVGVAVPQNLLAAAPPSGTPAAEPLTVKSFLTHLVPTSIVDAMARNEILQIVVFAVLFGLGAASLPQRAPAVLALADQVSAVMLKVTGFVMKLAPLAIFAAMAGAVAAQGVEILWVFVKFIEGFYLALAILWAFMLAMAGLAWGAKGLGLLAAVREPVLLAFSTTSSEAAFPKLMERLEAFGVPPRIVSFVLPLAYSFNLTGSMMYLTFALVFIAQVFHVPLTLGQEVVMLLILMVSSKGVAGVPRSVMVVLAATLPYFHLPMAGVPLVLAVDHIMDMGRSSTNVLGNAVASLVVARWRFRATAGAGIVADSDPSAELAETESKISGLRRALVGEP
jgi:Na+/H+-dicarboxylate symporter